MWPLIGQDRAVAWLERSLKQGRVSHAYLFLGPPHVGKGTLALSFAQALNCQDSNPPCGQCPSCHRIATAKHSDVQFTRLLKDAQEIGIDQIKDLQQSASLPPYEGKRKVFIIDEADRMSQEASNCLLKTLEEPPAHVVIILTASAEDKLLPTVISRCQRIELKPVPSKVIEQALVQRDGMEALAAKRLARLSDGCPGLAFSPEAREDLLTGRPQRLAELIALEKVGNAERFTFAGKLANQFSKRRASLEEELKLWSSWWRDLLLAKTGQDGSIVNVDLADELKSRAGSLSLAQISGFLSGLNQAMRQLEQNANPRLVLEVLMLDLPRQASA